MNTETKTAKPAPVFYAYLSEDSKEEWLMKEEGSFEDAGRPTSGHVVNILRNSPINKVFCYTHEEVQTVMDSAAYQTTWDNTREVIYLKRAANRIKQLAETFLHPYKY